MNFASDNTGPAAPQIMDAVMRANEASQMPYGNDPFTEDAVARIRDLFEAPEASVRLVTTGTAANALALATLTQPWQAVFCHEHAHVETDECGAPEFFTGGAKLRRVAGGDGKMTPATLSEALASFTVGDVHMSQPGTLTLTQLTELGTAYTVEEIKALTTLAKSHDLATHLDGARFANAMVTLGCTPAEMTWKAGIDAVSFGGTKNGCMGVEAVIFFDPQKDWEVSLRRKRAGHLWSKGKYLGAQMAAYLADGLWLDLAARGNARMDQLIAGLGDVPGARIDAQPAGNLVYLDLPRAAHDRAFAAGIRYSLYNDDPVAPRARIVCDWSKTPEDVDTLLRVWRDEAT